MDRFVLASSMSRFDLEKSIFNLALGVKDGKIGLIRLVHPFNSECSRELGEMKV
jgi:hypothetical protein